MAVALGGHPDHWKTAAGGRGAAVVEGEAARSRCPAEAAEVGARWHIRPLEGAAVVAGQQTRGEEGRKGEKGVVGSPGTGNPWEEVAGACSPSAVVAEAAPEGEQSPAWSRRGIRSEELVADDSG